MKKNILKLITLPIIAIGFIGCGDGDANFSEPETIIDISIPCETTPTATDISNYISLNSGDVIIKDTQSTNVSIYHDTTGSKTICLVSGSAHILRKD